MIKFPTVLTWHILLVIQQVPFLRNIFVQYTKFSWYRDCKWWMFMSLLDTTTMMMMVMMMRLAFSMSKLFLDSFGLIISTYMPQIVVWHFFTNWFTNNIMCIFDEISLRRYEFCTGSIKPCSISYSEDIAVFLMAHWIKLKVSICDRLIIGPPYPDTIEKFCRRYPHKGTVIKVISWKMNVHIINIL